MSFVSANRLSRVVNVPASLPQTELRRGRDIVISTIELQSGQTLEIRALTLGLISILSPDVVPDFLNDSFGYALTGLTRSLSPHAASCLVSLTIPGTSSLNPHVPKHYSSPGIYRIMVWNNTSNVNLSVSVTCALKIYL